MNKDYAKNDLCPWCGSYDLFVLDEYRNDDFHVDYKIRCEDCGKVYVAAYAMVVYRIDDVSSGQSYNLEGGE